jgi:DNA recombination protein RmuC
MDSIDIIIGLIVGVVIGYFIAILFSALKKENVLLKTELETGKIKIESVEAKFLYAENEVVKLKNASEIDRTFKENKIEELATIKADYNNLEQRLKMQQVDLENSQKRMQTEFENLANKILEEKSKKFVEQNKNNLSDILQPLKERLFEFQTKVEQTNKESIDRNSTLIAQIKQLSELNTRMSKEAENLTRALKGDSKKQGDWGEVILERILEESGLEKNREYFTQQNFVTEDGRDQRPDVIIKLPDGKNIIIDSKVSITAFEKYNSCEDDDEKEIYLREHIKSIRSHVKNLHDKNYNNLKGLDGLDFALMFIPLEPALSAALNEDRELYMDAYNKKIVLVSPTNMIIALRTIASMWKQEKQNKNALKIAEDAGNLYDKFVNFTTDLIRVGKSLNESSTHYSEAMKKLSEGNGNIISRVENLKKMGARASKSIEPKLIERASQHFIEDISDNEN